MTWADTAGIMFGVGGILIAIVAAAIARRSNVIAIDALDRAETANKLSGEANGIASDALGEVRRSNDLQESALAVQSARNLDSLSAKLTFDRASAMWDSEWIPQVWHYLGNRGAAYAHDVRWQVLEAAPDRYGPELGLPLSISPNDSKHYAEWRAPHAVYRDASIVVLQFRYLYRDGNGPHSLVVRLGIGAPNPNRNNGSPTVGVVFATLDSSFYAEIPVDQSLGVYVDM